MNIQSSFVGLAIIVFFYLFCAGILVLIGLRMKSKKWRKVTLIPLALIVLSLPWIDEVLTAWNFKEVCKNAGVHVTRKVEVEGFLNGTSQYSSGLTMPRLITDRGSIMDFDRLGYRYTERPIKDGKVLHLERVAGGVQVSILERPQARYHFMTPIDDADAGRATSCSEDIILDSETQETIARYRYCKRYASFPERMWQRLVHRGPIEYCPSGEKKLRGSLFHEVLIPVRKL